MPKEQPTSIPGDDSLQFNDRVQRAKAELGEGHISRRRQVLYLFLDQQDPKELVPRDDLAGLFEGTAKPEQSVCQEIYRLNRLLKDQGLEIAFVPAYQLRPIDTKSNKKKRGPKSKSE